MRFGKLPDYELIDNYRSLYIGILKYIDSQDKYMAFRELFAGGLVDSCKFILAYISSNEDQPKIIEMLLEESSDNTYYLPEDILIYAMLNNKNLNINNEDLMEMLKFSIDHEILDYVEKILPFIIRKPMGIRKLFSGLLRKARYSTILNRYSNPEIDQSKNYLMMELFLKYQITSIINKDLRVILNKELILKEDVLNLLKNYNIRL